jgi:hypothetical protein
VISDLILAYRAIKEQKARDKAYKNLVGKDPDYGIIRALINEARTDVVATVTFPNGTKLDLKKADAFDRYQKMQLDPERAGAL